jgi:hypothetical protein
VAINADIAETCGRLIDTGWNPDFSPNNNNRDPDSDRRIPPPLVNRDNDNEVFPSSDFGLSDGLGGFGDNAPPIDWHPGGFGERLQDLGDLVPPFFEAKSSSDPFGQIPFDSKEEAAELGYDRRVPAQKAPFNSHCQVVFSNGRDYITRDIDSHNGGVWKKFDRRGRRTGTYDGNLNRIGE